MIITFIDPPPAGEGKIPERVFGCTYELHPFPNIFLLYLASALEAAGHTVAYRNAPLLGWDRRRFDRFLVEDRSEMYVIYSVYLARQTDLAAYEQIRRHRPDVPLVFVGPAPTYEPDKYLKDERTWVIRGEMEDTLVELAGSLKTFESIAGLSYLKGAQTVHNPPRAIITDLDRLPTPARHLIEPFRDKYFNPKLGTRPFTAVLTSRGCSYACTYCVPCSQSFAREIEFKNCNTSRKPKVMKRSPEAVGAEFEALAKQGYKAVSVLDDQFLWEDDRTIEMCRRIGPSGIRWGVLARADRVRPETAQAMAEAGCCYVDLGIESFDQKVLDDIKKGASVEEQLRGIRLIQESGMDAKLNIMFGSSPLEDRASIEKTLRLVKELNPSAVMFSICNPFPGTDLYKTAKEKHWFIDGDYVPRDVQKEANTSFKNLSAPELEAIARKANRDFYLRPSYLISNLMRFASFREMRDALKTLVKKLSR